VILRIAKRFVLFFSSEEKKLDLLSSFTQNSCMFIEFYSGVTALWSALTLITTYENRPCYFQVLKVSPYLISLANTSRSHSPHEYESLWDIVAVLSFQWELLFNKHHSSELEKTFSFSSFPQLRTIVNDRHFNFFRFVFSILYVFHM
jgi:hypothetical protein